MWIRPLACVAFVLAGAWPVCAEQTSDRAVGLSFASYADAKRSAWDSNGPRPLAATLWYPVPPGTAMQEWPTAFLLSGPHAMRAPLRAGDDYRDERVRAAAASWQGATTSGRCSRRRRRIPSSTCR